MLTLMLTACDKESADSYYKAGLEAMEDKKYEEANKNFEEAIARKDDKADYYLNNAMSLTMLGEYDAALAQYDKAILDVDSSITLKNKKKALRGKGVIYYKQGEYSLAEKMFLEALDIAVEDNLNEDIRCYLADTYKQEKKYEAAKKEYTKMLEEEELAYVYAYRAGINVLLEKKEEAIADLDKAIEIEEDSYTYYFIKYETLQTLGEPEQAKEVLAKALELPAKTVEDRYQVAKIKYYQKDYENATADLMDIKEEYKVAYQLLGDIYFAQEEYTSALESYVTYLGTNKNSASATLYNQMALCSIQTKNYEQAKEYVEAGLKFADKSVERELKYNEILVNEQVANFDKAYKLAVAYLEEYPEDQNVQRELIFLETRKTK